GGMGMGGMGGMGGAGGMGTGGMGGPDGGAQPPPPSGVPYKFCVPDDGLSCPCDDKRDGVVHTCFNQNLFGSCPGVETCNGAASSWEGCDAAEPEQEVCNAFDDDCDEEIDNADPTQLCGPEPPNGAWTCNQGTCEIGGCDPGWTNFPPGAPSDGCACSIEAQEPNDTCADAKNAGSVSDASPASVLIQGTLSSNGDVDVWSVDTVDTAQGNTNTYHVSIDFTAPMPNDEFLVDVIRGDACADMPTGPGVAITAYDWCVDGTSAAGNEGELGCGPTAPVRCGNHTSKYYVRVYRKPGATATCTPYEITVTATGGDPCDFTQKCP
ncbi:MAG TPA: hypothetical protein VLS89_10800, partial [Candidatus Nanopelagicales bacterium]|nr:hypothetical protein [Candidatus Nanopelagicales bacterium]